MWKGRFFLAAGTSAPTCLHLPALRWAGGGVEWLWWERCSLLAQAQHWILCGFLPGELLGAGVCDGVSLPLFLEIQGFPKAVRSQCPPTGAENKVIAPQGHTGAWSLEPSLFLSGSFLKTQCLDFSIRGG